MCVYSLCGSFSGLWEFYIISKNSWQQRHRSDMQTLAIEKSVKHKCFWQIQTLFSPFFSSAFFSGHIDLWSLQIDWLIFDFCPSQSSLVNAIVNMAQDFVGAANVPLLRGIGQVLIIDRWSVPEFERNWTSGDRFYLHGICKYFEGAVVRDQRG